MSDWPVVKFYPLEPPRSYWGSDGEYRCLGCREPVRDCRCLDDTP